VNLLETGACWNSWSVCFLKFSFFFMLFFLHILRITSRTRSSTTLCSFWDSRSRRSPKSLSCWWWASPDRTGPRTRLRSTNTCSSTSPLISALDDYLPLRLGLLFSESFWRSYCSFLWIVSLAHRRTTLPLTRTRCGSFARWSPWSRSTGVSPTYSWPRDCRLCCPLTMLLKG
jgi:hypothetical protein